MSDEPTETELHSYIDDQLDPGRRYAVEAHLSDHPALAARIMGELSRRSALRLFVPSSSSTTADAPKQGARSRRRKILPIAGLSVAAGICAALLIPGGQPAYVDMAVASHRVAVMRAHMASQVEAPALDAKELLARARIDLPPLPADWRVTDVQLFPTQSVPAVLVAVRTGEGRQLSLFALRQRSSAPEIPDAVREGSHSVAYWRRGEMSYALTGDDDARTLDLTAEELNRFWS